MGYSGSGSFTQSSGTNTIVGCLYVGNSAGSNGNYNLGGSGYLTASYLYLGNSGTGSFTQSGGTNNIGNALQLGSNRGASGAYTLNGNGLLTTASRI